MFERFYVTSLGQMLLAKTQIGKQLKFTRMRIGDGVLPDTQNIEALTELVSPIKYLPIASLTAREKNAVITGQFSNSGLAASFWFREIGLYADDPERGEILYAYANAGDKADNIPSASTSPVDFAFAFNLTVGNADQVTVVIDDSLVFATQAELTAAQQQIAGQIQTAISKAGHLSARDLQEITDDELTAMWSV